LAIDSSCGLCDWPVESVLHIFRDCERAQSVWHALSIPGIAPHFFKQDFIPWLKVNLLSKAKWGGGLPWSVVFVFTCWYLWKWRNKHIFLPLDDFVADPVKTISMAVRDWVKASQAGVKMSPKAQLLLSWEPPGLGKGQIPEAELWGLYFGLHLACEKGISNLLIEMDAAVVVSLVQQVGTLSCHPLAVLIQSCCEMNVVADRMANWSFNLDLGV
ncbi:unnamed protein product, partial [Prunus brigantina]